MSRGHAIAPGATLKCGPCMPGGRNRRKRPELPRTQNARFYMVSDGDSYVTRLDEDVAGGALGSYVQPSAGFRLQAPGWKGQGVSVKKAGPGTQAGRMQSGASWAALLTAGLTS